MKKKLAAIALVIVITVVMGIPVFAAGGGFRLGQTSLGIKVGETAGLVSYYDSYEALGTSWSTSNPDVATVDEDGNVTGVKLGQAVITATSGTGDIATCCVHVALKGIDVSRYQYNIDWNSVKNAGIDFAIIRTGFGGEAWEKQTDPYFEANYSGAVQNGIKVGVYHYSYATTTAMAEQEADMCLSILNGRRLDFPVFYDVENSDQFGLSTDTLAAIVDTFCSKIQQAGYKVGLYSYLNFYRAHLTSPVLDQYDKWVANTGVDKPGYTKPYTIWQYGQRAVSGISGNVDVNYSYTDYSGSGGSVGPTPPEMPKDYFESDTTGTYTFGTNTDYYYKITTPDTYPPSAVSSNPSAVTVQRMQKLSDGFLFKITSVGAGQATITTTAGDGRSVSFVAVGKAGSQPPAPPETPTTPPAPPETPTTPTDPSTGTIVSDTPSNFSMKLGNTYQFKFTPGNSSAYTFTSGNSSILQNVSTIKKGKDYYFKVKAVGTGDVGVYAREAGKGGPKVCVVTVKGTGTVPSQNPSIVSDTPSNFSMKLGSTYQFKFTPGSSAAYTFTTANSNILKNVSTVKIGNDYYYKVKAVSKGCVGVYAKEVGKGGPRVCVVTVS